MPWVRANLRGQLVYARATETGELAESGGRVEIRYKPMDGRRYDAMAGNLKIEAGPLLPDDTCAPAEKPAAAKTADNAPGKAAAKPAKKKAKTPGVPVEIKPGTIIAYTDGACTGNPGPAGCGVVILKPDGRSELSEYLGEATNNIAELVAIERAIELTAPDDVVVHTDSQYAIGVLSKGWKAKANTELIMRIRALLSGRAGVDFVYVPGHAGVPLNERADELARLAIKTRQTKQEAL
jgi:ribonuclease HI